MNDSTEKIRRRLVTDINSQTESNDEDIERKRLETKHGQVWNTPEIGKDFEVKSFLAPFVLAKRKSDDVEGTMMFQDYPRFYFGFKPV